MMARDGGIEYLAVLLNAVQVSYLLQTAATRLSGSVLSMYRRAEHALEQCVQRANAGAAMVLTEAEREAIAKLMPRFDRTLESVSVRRLFAAQDRVRELERSGRSPIPV